MEIKYYDLTAPQKSIWLTEQYYKDTNINNVCGTFYSTECLDFEILKKALNVFLQNNDSFKIKLHFTEDKIAQYFSELENIDFKIIDVKNKEEQTALEEKQASKVFSMLDSLLFDIVLFRYPDNHGGFVINSHHLISDSWTNGLVANNVALIYSKIKNNEPIENSGLSYKDYIASELNYVQSEKFQKDKTYWNDLFTTIPEVATIPSIKNGKSEDDLSANRLLLNVDNNVFKNIKLYCDKNKVSFYNFFMSIFALYLGRVSNLDEFVIGTPILNRTNYKEKNTTGMFINTLPLKINLNHEKTFLENLKEIAVTSMSLLRHQKYSYQYLIEDLRKKDSNLPKLYNVLYSYQITKMNENLESLNHATSWTFNKTIADDLDIHMFEWNENNSIQIAYDYRISKYDEQDILDLNARIMHVINQVLENENILLKEIEIVTPEEKHKILYEFNNTKVDYPKDKTIVDLFEEQVEKTPDNIAVVFEDQKLTYRELNEKANQLAGYLVEKGVKNNDVVALMFNRSLEIIISILAILKSSAAYLPLDPTYPSDRIKFILDDCNAKCLLTNSTLNKKYTNSIVYDKDNSTFNEYSLENLNTEILSFDLSYLIYTSGSTGTPKGVMLSHLALSNLVNYCNNYINYLKEPAYKSIVSITTISFDIFIFETLIALQKGLKVVFANSNEQNLPIYLNKLIEKENIEIIQTTPSRMQAFLNNINSLSNLKKLKYITLAGEQLPISLAQKLHNLSGATIYNGYGPSETTVFATLTDVTNCSKMTIGKPIYNTNIYILNNNLNIMPIGIPGEIYISGDNIGVGYVNNPELMSSTFINNPFNPKTLMYKSGDLGYYDKDGNIVCLGRFDHQVKIRGLRIELQEIEQTLSKIPEIIDCVVNKVVSPSNSEYLCAYYTKNKEIDINYCKQVLSSKLPRYMVPEIYMELSELPYTPNGKIDRKKLPCPNFEFANAPFVEVRNDIDKIIVDTLSNLLNLDKISILDSFFNIGGDSLVAISLSTKISKKLNILLSINNILEHPVIQDLSDYISTLSNENITNSISKTEKKDFYLTSSAQSRMYYVTLREPDSVLYNTAGGIIIDGALDSNKLDKCFNELIKRHSSLRTHFENREDSIVQIVDESIDFNLVCSNSNTDNVDEIYSNFVKPFDLSKAPLFRAELVRLKNNKSLLLLDMHHIISDGTSLNILVQELCSLYNGNILPEKTLEYKDFAVWEKEQLNTDEFKKSKEYWVNQFKNDEIPLLNMPTTYARPSAQSFEGSNIFASLNKDTYSKINNLSKELNITPYMLMLSAYYILLSKYTSQDDIVVGTPIVGRDMPELSNMLGMFVNTLALRNNVNHSISFEEFSKTIKSNCIESFKNQTYPFDMLVKDLNIKRDTSRNPLFDVMFVFQNNGYPEINLNGTKNVEYFVPNSNISKFDLTLEVVPQKDQYSMRFEYCTKLFDEDFIKRLSNHYINILNVILDNKEIKISDIDMLSEEEKNQILYEFNNTKVEYPKDKTIVDLFEEQVEKTPDNIAVVFEDQKLTYRELNEKANQLARYLIKNNASQGDMIGILLDKSLEMIISILAILKVGASFLPIDTGYPKERIDYILNDSKSKLLLTNDSLIHKSNDSVRVLSIEENTYKMCEFSNENFYTNYSVNNVAYVMYTSGSTGRPKGVMVTHKNITRLVKNNQFITFSENEHILQTGSIVFDACTFEIWGALLNGFKLFIMKKQDLLDPFLLKKYLISNNITTLWLTAPLFNQLSESDPAMFKNVKKLLTGGDVLSPKHINSVKKSCPNLTIINGYGPTENTTFSCCFTIDKEYSESIPIGKPISNSTTYIVSSSGLLCPIGVPGELWVGGDGVSNGYLNNFELTKEKFIDNPFGNGKIYKTGDLVKWLPNGNIEFIGRIDNQVKIRGFRVELNEINKRILENPYIKESYTTIKTINNIKHICSYLVATDKNLSMNYLKNYLTEFLPSYMIPTYLITMNKLPINQNGKIDKNLLPEVFVSESISTKYEDATNDIEQKLLEIFQLVLQNNTIGITDNFFDVGGDSLTAMKLQLEAVSQNINISYSDIFKYPTVKKLANSINLSKTCTQNQQKDLDSYNSLLKNNNLDSKIICEYTNIGNILLTGFTGFLGAHILDSFLKKESGDIYCLIRDKNNLTAIERLYNTLHFYFKNTYDNLVGTRIKLINGDITSSNLGLSKEEYTKLGNSVSTIIHSAALVKHYGIYKDFEKININGTQYIVDFAKTFNCKLLHVSTISVSGNNLAEGSNFDNHFGKEVNFDETNFYIGQNLENLYVKSKFEAERIVLDAIKSGLSACILRMGNLTSRFSEGKFQQNHFENAFVNRLKSFLEIGMFPQSLLNLYCEFTPIDYCGDAIINIASHFNKNYTVFHLLNEKHVELDRLFEMLNQIDIHIDLVSNKVFATTIQDILNDASKRQSIQGIINDLTQDRNLSYKSEVNIKSDFTKEFLKQTSFEWPYIDIKYIKNYFEYLADIGYFKSNN